jgi:anti-sigma regulatory factor (Ser/Thr protein kinase)
VRSLGLGLAGSRRLVDDFDIQTKVGVGTKVTVTCPYAAAQFAKDRTIRDILL